MINEQYKWLTDTFIAHRGLFDNVTIPENSVPAFEKAAQMGFSIETDVQSTKDGVLVVFHDDTLERMTGVKGNLCDTTFEELRKLKLGDTNFTIPTFDEFLEAANGRDLVVEIKSHPDIGELEQKVYNRMKRYNGRWCVESFNPFVVRWFRQNAPEIVRGQLSYSYKGAKLSRWKCRMLANLKFCKWNGSQFVAFDAETIKDSKAVKKWKNKVPVICWTVKSAEQYEQLHSYFDNMIFDSFLPERTDLKNK